MAKIETPPPFGEKPIGPAGEAGPTGKAGDFSLGLKNPTGQIGSALDQALSQGDEGAEVGGKYYLFAREKAGKNAFWVNVEEYAKKPGKGDKPLTTYKQAYFVKTRSGMYRHFEVFVGKNKKAAPSLNTKSSTPTTIPSNLKQLAEQDPAFYNKFYQMLIKHLALTIMANLRKQQKKMKSSMQDQ